MFDIPSFRLGKVFGIPFEVNLSWVVIFALVALTLATSYYPDVTGAQGAPAWVLGALGIVTALLFFASILAHELCHAVVTRLEGGKVEKITLFIFGGVAQIQDEPRSPGRELLMAASGPAMSILIAGVCFLGYTLTATMWPWWLTSPLWYLATINLFVGVFNLLPGFPLDGGRVLRSILWGITGDILKATRWAARSGQFIGWGMVALALLGVLNGDSGLIWFGLVGWFIAWLAGAAYRQQEVQSRLADLTVERIMTPHPDYVDGELSVDTFVHDHLLGRQHSRYPVIDRGVIVGVVSLGDVKTIARADWPYVKVVDITDKDLGNLSVDASTPVHTTLGRLSADKPGALLVVREGRLAGIVTRSDVLDVLNRSPLT
ncbi:MAG TPA: site-2 protease family protein [Coriobacteriia bacterium]